MDLLTANALDDLHALAQALLVVVLGGAVGWERETAGKSAGLRTMILVALAAFLFVEVTLITAAALPNGRADPTRAIQSIATGLPFLGAGIVFREGNRTRGLTTAASVLAVAPIGIAVALDRYVLAVGATLLLLFVLRVLERFDRDDRESNPA